MLVNSKLVIINIVLILFYKFIFCSNEITEYKEDDYYLIYVNNTYLGNSHSNKYFKKQQEYNEFIEEFMNTLDSLIEKKSNTYKNQEKLEKISKLHSLKKRENSININEYSTYGNYISTLDETSVFFAYLSNNLVDIIKSFPFVISCERNMEYQSHSYYSKSDILLETQWNNISIKKNTDLHLSLISQGMFNEKLINKYDTNYYYPESSGEDIDIFIVDTSFDFRTKDFSNIEKRIVKCAINITDGDRTIPKSSKFCFSSLNQNNHGTGVASVAAGLNHGVASLSNIYGILINKINDVNIIESLRYILSICRNNKGIIIMTFGGNYELNGKQSKSIKYIEEFIGRFSSMGIITVVSAGNEGVNVCDKEKNLVQYPCFYKNVICVGGIDNVGGDDKYDISMSEASTNIMNNKYYRKAKNSNYGEFVNIYAPYYVKYDYCDINNKCRTIVNRGTSFSAPIVAGVIATIMSENNDVKFSYTTVLNYLNKLGLKNIINGITEGPNLFINNGKHVVYSKDYIYYGCGINSGNQSCENNQCCGANGKCYNHSNDLCKTSNGCQVEYGKCTIITSNSKNNLCGFSYGNCHSGYCCSYEGICGKTNDHCGVGCQKNYGHCL